MQNQKRATTVAATKNNSTNEVELLSVRNARHSQPGKPMSRLGCWLKIRLYSAKPCHCSFVQTFKVSQHQLRVTAQNTLSSPSENWGGYVTPIKQTS